MHNHNWSTENFHHHIGIERKGMFYVRKKVTLP